MAGELLRARLLLRQQLKRIEEPAVREDFVMEVIAGRAAGRAETSDDVAALHALALLDREAGEVAVLRLQAEAVIDDHEVAVRALMADEGDVARGGRLHRLSLFAGDVEARMVVGAARDRVAPVAHR